jgi:hypothetical protein
MALRLIICQNMGGDLVNQGGFLGESAVGKQCFQFTRPYVLVQEHALFTVRFCLYDLLQNRIVGQDPERIVATYREVMEQGAGGGRVPPLWDGRAAERIVEVMLEAL